MTEIATNLGLGDAADISTGDLPDPATTTLYDLPTPQARNQQRGLYAGGALKTYATRTGLTHESIQTAIGDLLGDLRHLCDALDLDFDACDNSAENHYLAEIGGEG